MITSLWVLLGVAVGGMVCYKVGWRRGFRRGRDIERMEPPRVGALHFKDGAVWSVRANSPLDAMERVARIGGKAW